MPKALRKWTKETEGRQKGDTKEREGRQKGDRRETTRRQNGDREVTEVRQKGNGKETEGRQKEIERRQKAVIGKTDYPEIAVVVFCVRSSSRWCSRASLRHLPRPCQEQATNK